LLADWNNSITLAILMTEERIAQGGGRDATRTVNWSRRLEDHESMLIGEKAGKVVEDDERAGEPVDPDPVVPTVGAN
jgi:hypothetical protein